MACRKSPKSLDQPSIPRVSSFELNTEDDKLSQRYKDLELQMSYMNPRILQDQTKLLGSSSELQFSKDVGQSAKTSIVFSKLQTPSVEDNDNLTIDLA